MIKQRKTLNLILLNGILGFILSFFISILSLNLEPTLANIPAWLGAISGFANLFIMHYASKEIEDLDQNNQNENNDE